MSSSITKLVLNLSKVGIWDWDASKPRNIVVTAMMSGQTTHQGISRNAKHISVIPRIFTPEKSLIPDIIPLQYVASAREELKKQDVGFGTNLILKSNLKPYINAGILLMTSEL
jgi:hypothetical protein